MFGMCTLFISTNVSANNTTLYLYTIKIVYCQGDMFRPLLRHLQTLWENRSKNCLCPTMHWNINSSCICFLRGPEDDLIKVETCRPDNTLFLLYINKVLCYWLKCCIYMLITLRDGKRKKMYIVCLHDSLFKICSHYFDIY